MKSSEHLFELIKSLNKSEKGYFKKFSSMHTMGEKNNYIKLFDAIEKQKQYNEKKLLQFFKEESFINNFSVAKAYLYDIILQSLESFHKNIDSQLRSYLHRTEILFEKGLYKQCDKLVSKALEIALQYESHSTQIELWKFKIKLMLAQSFLNVTEKELEEAYQKMFQAIEEYKNSHEYNRLVYKFQTRIIKQGHLRNIDDLTEYNILINDSLFQTEEKALSFQAKYNFYLLHCNYSFAKRDFHNAYNYAQKIIQLMESNPLQITKHPKEYAFILINLIIIQLDIKKYSEIPSVINKLKTIPITAKIKSKELKSQFLLHAYVMELELYNETGQFNKGIKLIGDIQNNFNLLNKGDEINLYYIIAYTHVGAENYRAANIYINKILNNMAIDVRNDLQCFARILSLIIHYELNNQDLLEYTVKSTYRYLCKRKKLYQYETLFFHFIKKRTRAIESKKELIEAFKKLKKELEIIIKDPFEKRALDYFDLISWLESKIKNRPFAEVVKERAKINSSD